MLYLPTAGVIPAVVRYSCLKTCKCSLKVRQCVLGDAALKGLVKVFLKETNWQRAAPCLLLRLWLFCIKWHSVFTKASCVVLEVW